MLLHPGIGERFSYQRRKWVIWDIRDGEYTCKTINNDKKPELVKQFTKEEMIKLCK